MYKLKLVEVDQHVGLIFPEDVLARLDAREGDPLYFTETAHGYLITAAVPEPGNPEAKPRE